MFTSSDFPRIIRFDAREDAGEYGAALCPHCGAKGRYVWHFTCEDGTHRGAMAGCLQHFPVHPLAKEQQRLQQKTADYQKKGWSLNRAESATLDAIDAWQHAELTEVAAMLIMRQGKARMAAWRNNRPPRRY